MARFLKLPSRRAVGLWIPLLALIAAAWFLWSPGTDLRDGSHDRGANALWMQHGWLADDAWLARNGKAPARFRDPAQLQAAAAELSRHHIKYVYPHLCPCTPAGDIAASDPAQVERFLDAFDGFEVLPWVGGARADSALIASPPWREHFAKSCADLLAAHPRLAGVHVNIETMPSGNADFLKVLQQLRAALPAGKKISVAAYPPPTVWQPSPDVHWDQAYSRAGAASVDQAVIMMYDTSLHTKKLYEQLMKQWTRETLAWYAPKQVLLGVPAYEETADYHDPRVEDLAHALAGVHAGLGNQPPANYAGVSISCEWEMTGSKWADFAARFAAKP
ncbi:MAG TPA: glycosyl hydrolase family 18 protein [Phycisphaerae bacterium]|nr:glycosyl hydrolase family 18 protein [Phycisphaerae bacterium]